MPEGGTDPAVGQAAPAVTGSTFDGGSVSIGDDGRAKLVMFLAHWCPHCRAEVPVITDWLESAGMPEDVDLYAVSTGVSSDAPNYPPSQWLEDENWPVTTIADDADSSVATAFGLRSYPYFVAIDANGDVVARASGELTVEQLETMLDDARGTADPSSR
jgi:thiol-disulfide isomerase/thioredoxin